MQRVFTSQPERSKSATCGFCFHFTLTSSSRLNLLERFFRDLSQDVVLPRTLDRVQEQKDTIVEQVSERNLVPKRSARKARGRQILAKIKPARESLDEIWEGTYWTLRKQ